MAQFAGSIKFAPDGDLEIKPFDIKLDWEAYFTDFVKAHGEPLLYRGRQLFPDGWSYSATAYDGDEWSPTHTARTLFGERYGNELGIVRLKITYRLLRKRAVVYELEYLKALYDKMEELQRCRNRPLKQIVVETDGDVIKPTTKRAVVDFDLEALDLRIQNLTRDLKESDLQIKELKNVKQNADTLD